MMGFSAGERGKKKGGKERKGRQAVMWDVFPICLRMPEGTKGAGGGGLVMVRVCESDSSLGGHGREHLAIKGHGLYE